MIKNIPFGKSLEFSVVVEDGQIKSQELVSSNEDCLVSFKMDSGSFLTAKNLREMADFIDCRPQLALADPLVSQDFISSAKAKIATMFPNLSLDTVDVFIVAELLANQQGFTLYEERVSNTPKDTIEALMETADDDDDEDDEDDDDDDYDEDYDCDWYEEDDEDDKDWDDDDE